MSFIVIGVLATFIMDVWAILLKKIFSINGLDYSLLGRWVLHFKNGQFFHKDINQSIKLKNEKNFGYLIHYAIGVIFAKFLFMWQEDQWLEDPSLVPCLIIGWITVVAPFFIMQPAFGLGVAANKSPNMLNIWLKSFAAHTAYGVGLFIALRLSMIIV